MKGAIVGDVIGSVFEFHNFRAKFFALEHKRTTFTDDSVMTVAVADIILNKKTEDLKYITTKMQEYGRKYPHRGYGGSFSRWLISENPQPYNSFGNGAAMRISPVGFVAESEKQCIAMAENITKVSHDHPEGIKGAIITALCIYYAKTGKNKEYIKAFVSKYYNIDFNYKDLKRNYKFNETCQGTVPQAIYCFLISKNFTDCLRTSVSIGGDTDTLCAISCAIAEAYYGTTDGIYENVVSKYLDDNLRNKIDSLYERYGVKNGK